MDLKVVPLSAPKDADNIPVALRKVADDIEAGRYELITSAVLVLGHTSEEPGGPGITTTNERYVVFGMGPRHDPFTVRGLLMAGVMDPTGTLEDNEP